MTNNLETLTKECAEIQSFAEEAYSNEVEIMAVRLTQINVYLARTAEMLSIAKQIQDMAKNAVFGEHIGQIMNMSPSISKVFIESVTDKENRLVCWVEKLCSTLVHQGDNLRTQISLEKQMMYFVEKGGGGV